MKKTLKKVLTNENGCDIISSVGRGNPKDKKAKQTGGCEANSRICEADSTEA
jgi:hypothetical protein